MIHTPRQQHLCVWGQREKKEEGGGRREEGGGRREEGEGRREKGEGRREKGEGRRETRKKWDGDGDGDGDGGNPYPPHGCLPPSVKRSDVLRMVKAPWRRGRGEDKRVWKDK